MATQAAIWEAVANHPSWGTIWGQLIQKYSNRDRIYNEIWSNVDTHGVIPSFMSDNRFNAKETSLKWNGSTYATTLTDENGVLSKYNVISNNGDVQVSQNGNQLTLTTTNPNADGNNGDYSDDSYVATQAAIWEAVANHPSWGTIWGQLIQKYSNRDRIYNEIWSNVDTHGVIPSFMSDNRFNAKETSLKWNGSTYATTLTDENGVLSKYNVISNNGDVQVSQNGNQLTLTTTNPNADITLRLSKQGTTGGNTLYWVSKKQDVVTGGQDDPVHAYLRVKIESVGNVNLIKKSVTGEVKKQDVVTGGQDDPVHAYLRVKIESVGNVNLIKKSVTGEVIPNTQFRVVGNGVDTTVTTGANGEILVPNLVAGTYEVREVSVPSPYILDTTPKMVEIKPNTTATVEFINDVAKGRVEVKKTSENGDLIQGAVFEIRQNGNAIEKITTKENGVATSSER